VSSNERTAGEAVEGVHRWADGLPPGILIVDDDSSVLEFFEQTLGAEYRIHTASNGPSGLEALEREEIALIIADPVLWSTSGVDFFERAIEIDPRAIRILLTGFADIGSLTRAVNEGHVYRVIAKPWATEEIRHTVARALEAYELASGAPERAVALAEANQRLRAENRHLRQEVERKYAFDRIIGTGPAMERVFDVMEKVAETSASVLISGEKGTGKALVARAIHYASPRKDARFFEQNCATLPDTLLESELFGHRRGAFTGAHSNKKGLFELAHGGTIFLDEIGETHPGMQVRLLRVLQDGEIRPLGASETQRIDVRVIAATHGDLRKDVENDRFREDLYHRLRIVEIELPPLRERIADVPALAYSFLESVNRTTNREIKGFSNEAMDALVRYPWIGNVRELENEIERAAVLVGDAGTIGIEMLSGHIRDSPTRMPPTRPPSTGDLPLNEAVDALKQQMILEAIQATGSKTRAAEKLGIPRQSLQKMMKRLNLDSRKRAE
jgi:two-component system response regulator HupR/HoxA